MQSIVEFKEEKPRFFSDFGGLRIKESGLRLGDKITIKPFNGARQEVLLSRLSYRFKRGSEYAFFGEDCEIQIPIISKVFTEYKLILCSKDPEISVDENARYLLRATGLNPFKLNGNYTFEAFLEYGDKVELEYTRLEINQPTPTEHSAELPLDKNLIQSNLSVLIVGETGTGKSRLANNIHENSLRQGPFVQINISSYSESLLESELFGHVKGAFTGAVTSKKGAFAEAHRGTLFIDEIDSLPMGIQTKLLLFLDNKKIRPVGGLSDQQLDVRLIFSSGKDLKELVRQDKMRRDFYYRLTTGGRIHLKPLRLDTKKITLLLKHFEKEKGVHIVPGLKKFYRKYQWPGNIRQLLGHLEQKHILSGGDKISYSSVDEELSQNLLEEQVLSNIDDIKSLEQMKKLYVNRIYERIGRNIKKTSKVLGVSPNTVRSLVKEVKTELL
ncbi:MAG: hypothetical protein CME70_09570 [Halobacteriovorax sp.]|nr:hypothetical protein [Halobacteriovorax sp.]